MDYEQLKAFTNNEIEPYLQYIEMWQCIMALGIKPYKDGNQWCYLYGNNIQEGVCGFGDTIDRAARDFYTNLKSDKLTWLEKQDEQKPINSQFTPEQASVLDKHIDKFLEQKPWSEEDEKILKAIHNSVDVECLSKNGLDYVVMVDWFKSLKDRVQPKQDWSEEDTQYINDTLALLSFGCSIHSVGEVQEWLQSLNNRVQLKQEWSEENIATFSRVISIVKWAAYSDHSHPILNDKGATELVERLNSIKDICTWKPTDEQITWLYRAADDASKDSRMKQVLNNLLSDLKKL